MDRDGFIKLIANTLSVDNIARQESETKLNILTNDANYVKMLIDVIGDVSLDQSVRLSSCLLLKSVVSKSWRVKDSPYHTQKPQLRDALLLILANSNDKSKFNLKDNISRIVGEISRHDYPENWSNLVTLLIEMFEKSLDSGVKKVALNTLKYVYSQVASRKLRSKDTLNQLTLDYFKYFVNYWQLSTQYLLESQKQLSLVSVDGLDILQFHSKILRRVMQHGFTKYQESPEIAQFFQKILQFLQILIPQCVEQLNSKSEDEKDVVLVDKYLKLILVNQKILIKCYENEPLQFVNYLPMTLEYFTKQIVFYNPHGDTLVASNMEALLSKPLIQAINFSKSVIDSKTYQKRTLDDFDEYGNYETEPMSDIGQKSSMNTGNDEKGNMIDKAQTNITSFYTFDCLSGLLKSMVSNLLIITKEELELWNMAPEEYYVEADAKTNDASNTLKGATYECFVILMRHFHKESFEIVRGMLEHVTKDTYSSVVSDQSILLKESCYMTMGLGYAELYEKINFSVVFANLFVQELHSTDERFKIIKRRILWLMSYWSPIPESQRITVLKIYLECLSSPDLVIALTAADSLKAFVDSYDIEFEEFSPYLETTLHLFLELFHKSVEDDSKVNLLSVLSSIFLKSQENIKRFSNVILSLFKSLWSDGLASELLQVSVIRSMTFFIQALNGDPSEFNLILIPMIDKSTKTHQVMLLEDGLELWFHTMCRVSVVSQELVQLFPNLLSTMDRDVEHMELCLKILDTYMICGRDDLFRVFGDQIVESFYYIVGDVLDDQTPTITKPLMRIIQLFPTQSPVLLQKILVKVLDNLLTNQDLTPLAKTEFLSIFSRLITMNPMGFCQILDSYPLSTENADLSNRSQIYSKFFTEYFENLDSIATSDIRKLTAIAMCNLLPIQKSEIIELIPSIITFVVGMRADINQSEFQIDYLEDGNKLPDFSLVDKQNNQIQKSDPVYNIDLQTYLSLKINEASSINPQIQQIIQTVDKTILQLAFPK
ncbi:hypothetical protein DLAC_00182 [Tieghemostelium lacteum]|uniref:Importin N-terminal domain-containing protein n=1 Tax=Tieghemostelium lacteum TaxID=361077 RepID=A0A152A9H8_TIELA|nr:hypothetical protein DLAC_00182 [Tieghemostelium lacteum]|eukprot:KYR02717.1 hypothetical protein DLAC_00182 [Tieghemostelium lacteum]